MKSAYIASSRRISSFRVWSSNWSPIDSQLLLCRRKMSLLGGSAARAAETRPLNSSSRTITEPKEQGASQAMLYATGLKAEDMTKPQVGIASMWYEGNPCNMHLLELGKRVKEGAQQCGMVAFQFNTIGVSDGISMGTDGMRYSLQTREIIADSIESVMCAQWYDANISIPGCDKNMPGALIAMARLNRPSLMVYGGTIKPGKSACMGGADIDIVSAFQAYGEYISGKIDDKTREDIVKHACPGAGACGGMYTANTMASAAEAMGMTLPGSSSFPAESPEKLRECAAAGSAIKFLLEKNIRPKDIMTRAAFENAMVVTMALGGSTNAVLHLLAIASACNVSLTIDDFQKVSDRTPFIADMKPSGKYTMNDLHMVGGIPAVLKYLHEKGLIDGSIMTVTGKSLAENLAQASPLLEPQDVIKPLNQSIKPEGHLQILYGNLAPQGSVAKITGKEGTKFVGKARCFDDEASFIKALQEGKLKKGEKVVVVIRYEGPRGGPGMPEMLKPSSAIMGAGLGGDIALLTDGRFSGGSHGFLIGHIVPEAQDGGPIALVNDDDQILINALTKRVDVLISDEELMERQIAWVAPPLKYSRGTLYKFAKNVSDASKGCVTDL